MNRTFALSLLLTTGIFGCMHRTSPQSNLDSANTASRPAADNKETAISIYDAMNTGNFEKLDQFFTKDFLDHDPSAHQAPGLIGLKQSLQELKTEFPDLHFAIEQTVAESDLVAVRYQMTGTNTGATSELPQTDKKVDVNGFDLLKFSNGKVTEHWGLADNMKMLDQLGMLGKQPEPKKQKK